MKRKLIFCTAILPFLFALLGLVSCSETNTPNRQLQEKDLIGKLWHAEIYEVLRGDDPKYQLTLLNDYYCTFEEGNLVNYLNTSVRESYRISGDVLFIEKSSYKIKEFNENYIELISTYGLNSGLAQSSGFGYIYKLVLTRE